MANFNEPQTCSLGYKSLGRPKQKQNTKYVETIKFSTRIKKQCNFTEDITIKKIAFAYI